MIPAELTSIADIVEDGYNIRITKTDISSGNLVISFSLFIYGNQENNSTVEYWTIEPINLKNIHVDFFGWEKPVWIQEDHPLLWEFMDIQCELYYNGWCHDAPKLFFDLYTEHKRVFGDSHCFSIPFNIEKTYPKLSAYSNGLLTKGPKKLMEKYAGCLSRNGLEYNIIGERPAQYWDGKQYVNATGSLKVLFLGQTFIVAESFIFKKTISTTTTEISHA